MAEYEVGYKKPPKHTQFKKGISANPGGRPKPAANMLTALDKILSAKVTIRVGGETRSVSRLEAALDQLVSKATTGETAALRLLAALLQTYQQPGDSASNPNSDLKAADQRILNQILGHFGTASQEI